MGRRDHLVLIAAFSCLLASCTTAANHTANNQASAAPAAPTRASLAPASCPVTRPPQPPFTPPSPYSVSPPPLYQGFWYGTEALWTMPDTSGIWERLPYHDGVYVQKVFWWRHGHDYRTDPQPDLIVTAKRLDAPAPSFTASGAKNGSRDDLGSFMIIGVDIPTLGCWEITGHSAGTALSFVVWVAP